MPLLRDLSSAQIAFQIAGEAIDQFLVVRFRGTEGLCRLYRFEIELTGRDASADFESYVGRSCVLSVNSDSGARWFHGMISRLELTDETVGQCTYRAEMVPAIWTLTHRYASRIFQNKTTPEIIEEILRDAGISGDRVRFGPFEGRHQPRDYCVQYRETDYNFICRLMEEEGIWWHFEQREDRHTLVLADSASAYRAIENSAHLPFIAATGLNIEEEHVSRFRRSRAIRPGAVVLRDFSFENPRLDLESRHDFGRDLGLEFSDYPGEYAQQKTGSELAKLRAEEFEAGRIHAVGQSNCSRLSSGRTFELTGHPSEKLNGAYLITSVTHQGRQPQNRTVSSANSSSGVLNPGLHQSLIAARQSNNSEVRELAEALLQIAARFRRGDVTANRAVANWVYHAGRVSNELSSVAAALGANPLEALTIHNLLDDPSAAASDDGVSTYECRFECIPATVVYRPSRITSWPVMRGSQTARVVGPEGEEIYTDKFGRVKVQFNWDRHGMFDEKSSCWIRVSQGSAGGQYGMMFLPRIGQEVIVDFLEGNPDQPIITGRVYNADQMPPYALPAEKSKSVIKTHSTKGGGGANEIRFEDLKDSEQILVYAQKDLHIRTNKDRVASIDGEDHLTVAENKYELFKKARHSEVKLDALTKIGGKQLVEVTGDVGEEFKSNHSERVSGAFHLKAGRKVVIEAGAEMTLKVGGNFIKIDAKGVTILGAQVLINSGGSPGVASAVTVQAPKLPRAADLVTPGKDVAYSGGSAPIAAELAPDIAGRHFKTSWIEVEVMDDEGMPVVGEPVEIVSPHGETLTGITGIDGIAHILVPEQGNCRISLPNLDGFAWEQIS